MNETGGCVMRMVIGLICFCWWLGVSIDGCRAQANRKLTEIPDEYTYLPDSMALYLDLHLDSESDKLEVLYSWMTQKMTYNVFPTLEQKFKDDREEVCHTLRKRTGICRHFTKVFALVAEKMDIPVFRVSGYIRNHSGSLQTSLHSWCVAKVDGHWYCYDPTFGMGVVHDNRFVSRQSMGYCKMSPQESIRDHMPCDPIFQLLKTPVSFEDFDAGKTQDLKLNGEFNFNDSILAYQCQSPLERILKQNVRVRKNGRINSLVEYFLQVNEANITVYRERKVYDMYSGALKKYNKGFDAYRELVDYKRRQFKPKMKKDKLLTIFSLAEENIYEAERIIHSQPVSNSSVYVVAVQNLGASIQELKDAVQLYRNRLLK